MMDHKQETRIVKKALKDAGMHARVTHGTGTGYGWLKIDLGSPEQRNGLEPHPRGIGMRYTEAEQERNDALKAQHMRQVAYNARHFLPRGA